MTARAIILEVKNGVCTVVTPEGEFRKVKLRGSYKPGQEIVLPDKRWKAGRLTLIAACLAMLLTATSLWRAMVHPAVAAYVSLEMNPAVELALDKDNKVRGVRPLDDAGSDLTGGVNLDGLPLDRAVDLIISEAVRKKFIAEADSNVIVFTVTPVGNYDAAPVEKILKDTAGTSLKTNGVSARVLVGNVPRGIREKAEKEGISTGRFMMFIDAAQQGIPVSPRDFKEKSIPAIEKEKKIKIRDSFKVEEDKEKPAYNNKDGDKAVKREYTWPKRPPYYRVPGVEKGGDSDRAEHGGGQGRKEGGGGEPPEGKRAPGQMVKPRQGGGEDRSGRDGREKEERRGKKESPNLEPYKKNER